MHGRRAVQSLKCASDHPRISLNSSRWSCARIGNTLDEVARLRYYRVAMKAMIRLLLSICLAITLPFHAAVGLAMTQSMAMAGVDRIGAEAIGHAMHAPQAHAPVDHAPNGNHGSHAAHDHHHASDDSSPIELQGTHCGTCTTCCTSIGLTGVPFVLPQPAAFDERIVDTEHPLTSVSSPRLERPPLVL